MSEEGNVKKFMFVNRKAPYGTIYALESLEARGLTEDDLLVDVTVMGRKELGELMAQQNVVLSF